jgi:hypothetical protein
MAARRAWAFAGAQGKKMAAHSALPSRPVFFSGLFARWSNVFCPI